MRRLQNKPTKPKTMKPFLKKLSVSKMSALFFLVLNFHWNVAFAENDTSASEKKQAIIQLSFYKKADQSRTAVAKAFTRNENGRLVFAEGIKMNFYALQASGELFLKEITTDNEGKAEFNFSKSISADSASGSITIIARIENDKIYDDAEAQSSVKEARVVLSFSEKDTSKLITATVTEIQPGGREIPAANVEVNFGVQRLFGMLPLSDEATVTTDENGKAVFVFPKEINGDENGNIILAAQILDNEVFGNVEAASPVSWGKPLVVEKNPFPRALWEPKAPVLLMVCFSIIFGSIWFTYFYIVYKISKIEKLKT